MKYLKLVIRMILIQINNLLTRLPINNGTILFESFNGRDINDNPASIYDYLIRQGYDKEKLFWGIKGPQVAEVHAMHPEVPILKRWSLRWIYVSARANYWIFNSRMPTWWHKNRLTTYVQTWHGTPLKKIGLDITDVEIGNQNTKQYRTEFAKESKRWDYLVAPNSYSANIFKHAFAFQNLMLNTGYPRNDFLINANNTDQVQCLKQNLFDGRLVDQKVILYAPTWRDDDSEQIGRYHFQWGFSLDKLMESLPEDVQVIIRPHYLVTDKIDIGRWSNRVIVDRYTDIKYLYLISDLMITDYSSVMFDYGLLKRPMIFFAYDLAHYADELRGFYFDYQTELPGPLVQTTDELIASIKQIIEIGFHQMSSPKVDQFNEQFLSWEDGKAARKVVEQIKIIK